MRYNFDEVVDRKNSNSLKYDFAVERGRPEDVLPLWVADMDFRTAPCITERLKKDIDLGIFGYSENKGDYIQAVSDWYQKYFNWTIEGEWLVKTPGIVFAIAAAVRAFTKEGDGVLIQQPVYYPFHEVIEDNDRILVRNDLVLREGHYEIDFEDFERKIIDNHVKLFLLCSPHNPVGRVWRKEELERMGRICLNHHVKVVSDEIHGDFVRAGFEHHVFTSVDKTFEDIAVICTAPSKTFNLAGLQVSNIFIPNEENRKKFQRAVQKTGYSQVNMLGLAACQAAYEGGREWLLQVKEYLEGNLTFVREYLKEYLPQIKLIEPEGTYLIWLDFRGLGLEEEEIEDLIVNKAGLWLDSGSMFGSSGEGFQRINIACPRSILKEALHRLGKAVPQAYID